MLFVSVAVEIETGVVDHALALGVGRLEIEELGVAMEEGTDLPVVATIVVNLVQI